MTKTKTKTEMREKDKDKDKYGDKRHTRGKVDRYNGNDKDRGMSEGPKIHNEPD